MQTTHNENKRKKVFLIATLLLALLLIFAFGTYSLSKYVSKDSGEGNATIAKWGYKVEVDDTKLFGQEYKKVNEGSWATVDGNGDVVVKAATGNDKNVIAPGTTGSMTISVTGNAEVAAELTVAMNATSVPTFVVTTGESDSTVKYTYSPVKFQVKVGGEAQEISSGTDKTVGTLEDVKSYLETTSNWGFTPYTEINKEFEIVWEWAFTSETPISADGESEGTLPVDVLDTWFVQYKNDETNTFEYEEEQYSVVTGETKTDLTFDISISLEQVQGFA